VLLCSDQQCTAELIIVLLWCGVMCTAVLGRQCLLLYSYYPAGAKAHCGSGLESRPDTFFIIGNFGAVVGCGLGKRAWSVGW
jgi:hypothetical protein